MRLLGAFVVILVAAIALSEAGYSVVSNTVLALALIALAVATLARTRRARFTGLAVGPVLALLVACVAFTIGGVAAFAAGTLWLGILLAAASGYLYGQVATRLRRHERMVSAASVPS